MIRAMSRRLPRNLLILISLGVLGGLGAWVSHLYQQAAESRSVRQMTLAAPLPLGPFELRDQYGAAFGPQQLHGRWSLLFFGYTHCPDVCPSTLQRLQRLSELSLEGGAHPIQALFVSVDPGRDGPQRTRTYLESFGPELLGLSDGADQAQELRTQLGIYSQTQSLQEDGSYLVDHTTSLFLIDPQARLVSVLNSSEPIGQLQQQIDAIRRHWRQAS